MLGDPDSPKAYRTGTQSKAEKVLSRPAGYLEPRNVRRYIAFIMQRRDHHTCKEFKLRLDLRVHELR
jgi:hypothetical protein